MIVDQPVNHRLERHDSRCSQDAGLSHTSTQLLASTVRLSNESFAATQHGSYRRAQPLAQTKSDRISWFRQYPGGHSLCRSCVENARSIHMQQQSAFFRQIAHRAGIVRSQ